MIKLAIMQPYFFPYIGYFQLISSVDKFIIYDNIKYTKKGWINRNRILNNNSDLTISLPLKKDSDYLNICDRVLSPTFNRNKLLNQIKGLYIKAPCFKVVFPLIENIIYYDNNNLFEFLYNSIIKICKYCNITTKIIISSSCNIDHGLKNQAKVLSLCDINCANIYINSIGGMVLYSADIFNEHNIQLQFLQSNEIVYKQFNNDFIANLSIIDVLMFNDINIISQYLNQYTLIKTHATTNSKGQI